MEPRFPIDCCVYLVPKPLIIRLGHTMIKKKEQKTKKKEKQKILIEKKKNSKITKIKYLKMILWLIFPRTIHSPCEPVPPRRP